MSTALAPRTLVSVLAALALALAGVSFAPSVAAAASVQAQASVLEASPTELSITVSGTGYSRNAPGIYVGLSERGGADVTAQDAFRGTVFVPSSRIGEGGTFTATLTLDTGDIATLDPGARYSVYTFKAHGQAVADPSQTFEAPVEIDFSALVEPEPTPEPTPDPEPEPDPVPEPVGPSVEVSSDEVSSQGSTTVTVRGTGFDPAAATGTRPPLAGRAAGAYVVFGKFAKDWRPSQGAPGASRVNTSQKWAVLASDMAAIGGPNAGAVELSSDGSFTAEVTVDKSAIDARATAESLVSYGIYTYPGSGAVAPSYETYTPITFVDPVPDPAPEPVGPSVEVSSDEVSSQGSTTVTVRGTGFDPAAATGTRPPLAGRAAGVYVVFGKFAKDWRPSQGAPGASRVNTSQKWAVLASDMAAIGGPNAGAVELSSDGSFTAEVTVDKSAIDARATAESLVSYGIYTYPGSGAVAPSYETYTPITFVDPAPEPVGPRMSATITRSTPQGLSVDVSGSGYLRAAPGIYVGIAESGGASATDAGVYRGTAYLPHALLGEGGTFSTTLQLDAAEVATLDPTRTYSVYSLRAHGMAAADPSQNVELPLAIDFATLVGATPGPGPGPGTPDPGTGPKPGSGGGTGGSAGSRTTGSLTWGVKAAFRSYVTGPIAKGSVAVGNGARSSGGTYSFVQRSSSAKGADAVGSTRYGGTVAFSGHSGALRLSLSDPEVSVSSASRATLYVRVDGRRTAFATLDLARATQRRTGGNVAYSGAPARLTASGASAFNGFYGAGESLDPVSFVVGSSTRGGSGALQTVASAPPAAAAAFEAPATPPSSTGLVLDVEDPDAVEPGQEVTASGEGFQPGETGIAVVVYSEPTVLATSVSADSRGRATWTGYLPDSLGAGEHTLTLQGSVTRGATFTIVEEEDEAQPCEVEDASMEWGLKESFRSYVSGSIAHGDWTTTGSASYATPSFTFADGSGTLDLASGVGEVAFEGSLVFTGHDGALDVTLADPVLKMVDEDRAVLFLDARSASMEDAMDGRAEPTETEGVPFVELDLSAGTVEVDEQGRVLRATGVPTTLTTQGHEVFSNYEPGTAFDPVDLVVTAGADCAAGPVEAEAAAQDSSGVGVAPASTGSPWLWALGGAVAAVALLSLLGAGLWGLRRRGGVA